VFFDFLWQRGKDWDAATADDLLDFEDWRRRSPRNMARISGAKWNRELAALRRLYEWAARQGHVTASPVTVKTVRDRHGDLVEVAQAWATDVRSSNVKWLTPRAFRLWRDVGLRGYTAEGRRDASWRGRHDERNAAFADLLFSSGLRRTEAGSLLTIELPALAGSQRYSTRSSPRRSPRASGPAPSTSRRPRCATSRRTAPRPGGRRSAGRRRTGATTTWARSGWSRR